MVVQHCCPASELPHEHVRGAGVGIEGSARGLLEKISARRILHHGCVPAVGLALRHGGVPAVGLARLAMRRAVSGMPGLRLATFRFLRWRLLVFVLGEN